jgi:hypothetical protein
MSAFAVLYLLSFFCATAYLLAPVFVFLAGRYHPKGDFVDRSHVWVNVKTRRKVGPATARQVYDKIRGPRAWEIKVERERKVLVVIGILPSLGICALASSELIRSGYLDRDRDPIPLFIGGAINIILYFFIAKYNWDDLYFQPIKTDWSGPRPRPDPDSLRMPKSGYFWTFFPFLIAALAVLQQIFFWLKAYRSAPLKLASGVVFSLFGLALIVLVYRKVKPYKPKRQTEKANKSLSKAEVIPALIALLAGQSDFAIKDKICRHLTALTGEDFGRETSDWEKWWEIVGKKRSRLE